MRMTLVISVAIAAISVFIITMQRYVAESNELMPEKYIAHAGGAVNGVTYSNSLEALNLSYQKRFKFFEFDFDWTTDSEVVLIHGWANNCTKLFNVPVRRYSLAEFRKFKMIEGLTPLTLEDLTKWLKDHHDAYIVTDFKERNADGLRAIASKYPQLIEQFIPQIYTFEEYESIKALGYNNIIITLYVSQYPDDEVIRFVQKSKVLAVTMPIKRALTPLPSKLNDIGVYVYSHTINDIELKNKLSDNKVNGFYTDYLAPDLNVPTR